MLWDIIGVPLRILFMILVILLLAQYLQQTYDGMSLLLYPSEEKRRPSQKRAILYLALNKLTLGIFGFYHKLDKGGKGYKCVCEVNQS